MKTLHAGEKRNVGGLFTRVVGTASFTVTSPQRRVLASDKTTVVTGFDWAAASYDSTLQKVFFLFDRDNAAFTANGTYYVQVRGTIDDERYMQTITVKAVD